MGPTGAMETFPVFVRTLEGTVSLEALLFPSLRSWLNASLITKVFINASSLAWGVGALVAVYNPLWHFLSPSHTLSLAFQFGRIFTQCLCSILFRLFVFVTGVSV